jgi:hypothetical protein
MRVAKEALNCLVSYATVNNGRYPWAAPVSDVTPPYGDVIGTYFGRIPDAPFGQTLLGNIPEALFPALKAVCDAAPPATPPLCMSVSWPATPACQLSTAPWWGGWKEQVFYGVAPNYTPLLNYALPDIILGIADPTVFPCTALTCLTVNPPSSLPDKQVVVMVAGRQLTGQTRAFPGNKDAVNFVEGENVPPPLPPSPPLPPELFVYTRLPGSSVFNDAVVLK